MENLLFPKVYMISKIKDGRFSLTDNAGFIPDREKWESAKELIQHFYDNHSDEEIEKYNRQIEMSLYEIPSCSNAKRRRKKIKGFVYFLKADNGLIKIGKTRNLNKRLDHFTTKLPYKLELIHAIETDDYTSLEQQFHNLYSKKAEREWFELNENDISEIKSGDYT